MRKRQGGQALILVLILLAIGTLAIVPLLGLNFTATKGGPIVTRQVKAMYAAGAAQEWVLWKLIYGNLASEFSASGETKAFAIDVCGIPVDITLTMRALPGAGGITLATDDVIKPTKTVTASNPSSTDPLKVANDSTQTFTYIIRLEQLSENTTQGLDAVYDILPADFRTGIYVANSSYIRVDGGAWQALANPLVEAVSNQTRLQWPASYDYSTDTGGFTSPIRDFAVRQVKEIKFQISLSLPSPTRDTVQVNWVVLKPWDSVSGPQAPIIVGTPTNPNVYANNGLVVVTKTSVPSIIEPGDPTAIYYTINMTNQDGSTHQVSKITDYLPPEFLYTGPSGGVTTENPSWIVPFPIVNGVSRQKLVWTFSPQVSLAAGETKSLTFWAMTTQNASGAFYNEVLAESNFPSPNIFDGIGVDTSEYQMIYSWNSGLVLVPFFDSRTEADNITIDSNIALIIGGVSVQSWMLR
ncbi:MAG: hypothetical protein Q8P00_03730 [Dehalococcoidia bacterium]|nr:hypothetical protein [Dehalococcoidia bacterium]